MSALGSDAPSLKAPAQTSSPTHKATSATANDGQRPGKVTTPTPTSAPSDAHTQGRAPAGWLR